MTKKAEPIQHYVILDSDSRRYDRYLGESVYLCRTAAEISEAYEKHLPHLTWISYAPRFTDQLLKTASRLHVKRPKLAARHPECVLTVVPPRAESVPSLHALFPCVVGDSPAYRWLPKEELTEVLLDPESERSDLVIAGAADAITKTLSLVRGDYQQIVIPFSMFPPSGDGIRPDFGRLRITDYGRTIGLGDYEASVDAILYEADPEFRKKLNRHRREHEKTFGASLLRLRKQRRLHRRDFSPLSAKTIARIERNEIGRPHGKTLQVIADRLGVGPAEIGSY